MRPRSNKMIAKERTALRVTAHGSCILHGVNTQRVRPELSYQVWKEAGKLRGPLSSSQTLQVQRHLCRLRMWPPD